VIDQRRLIQSRGVRSARDRIVFVSRSIWISNFNRDRSRRARRSRASSRAFLARVRPRSTHRTARAVFAVARARVANMFVVVVEECRARRARARRSTDDGS